MRLIFCGSGAFAIASLTAAQRAGHQVLRVITQPPKPSGRGGKVHVTPLADAARAAGLTVTEIQNINAPESVELIRADKPDVIVVADFGQMVRAAVRESAPLGAFNLHGSLLPELRGAAPVAWAIIRGYATTGVTTFSLVDKMDAGPIFLQAATDIRPTETAEELRLRLSEIGADLVCKTIDLLAAGQAHGQAQDESKATLAPRLKKSDAVIDWTADALAVRNRIHGVWPWPAGHAVFVRKDGHAVPVLIARAAAETGDSGLPAGTLDKDLLVATGRGRLRILEIQPAGKRLMAWRDFVNGQRTGPGDKFVPPVQTEKPQ